jgi:hypothetical protein
MTRQPVWTLVVFHRTMGVERSNFPLTTHRSVSPPPPPPTDARVESRVQTKLQVGNQRSWGSILGKGKKIFSSPKSSDRRCHPTDLLHEHYWVQSDRGVKLTTHLHVMPMLRMVESYRHSTIRLLYLVPN